ncbi:ABC transporter ATP-binding protein [Xanthobacter sp. TB0136]|uniref:ABC transporter ATP-binding protein n=1 Tax=Xanthobacter sp. TB0136 TaxID=3459177 RepID=UPI00403A00B2
MKAILVSHGLLLGLSALLSVLATGLGLVPYFAVYLLATGILASGTLQPDAVLLPLLMAFGAILLKGVLAAASSHLSHVAAYGMLLNLRQALARKLDRVPLGFFTAHSSGALKKTIADDVEQIEEAVAHAVPDLAAAIAVPLLSGIMLAYVDWRLALATLVMFPLLMAVYPLTVRATGPMSAAYFGALSQLRSATIQYVQGMRVIRAYMRADAALATLQGAIGDVRESGENFSTAALAPMSVLYTGLRANILVLIPCGSLLLLSGSVSPADLILFLLVGMGMNAPIMKLLFTGGSFYWRIKTAGGQINALLAEAELPEPGQPASPQGHALAFRNVSFGYGAREVIRHADFVVPANTMTAIVGPSGAGKSTLVRLAARFWDVDAGQIEIGTADIRTIERRSLAELVSFVLQDTWLMNDTIRANIRSGKPGASDEEIEVAARRARVLEFAEAMPLGLDSPAGEGGRFLSGGQRQRVAIARAMVRGAPIVLLDEATAALDPENETLVLEALAELARGRTVITIAHRLETIRRADQILYLDAGEVLARGTHEELLASCMPYRRLWESYQDVAGWHLERDGAACQPVPHIPQGKAESGVAEDEPFVSRRGLALLLELAGPMRRLLVFRALPLLFLEGLLMGAPVLATFWMLEQILDGTLTAETAWLLTGAVALCLILQALINMRSHRILWHVQGEAVAALQRRLARHLRHVPLGVLQARDTGSLETLMTQHAAGLNFVTPPAQAMRVLVGPLLSFAVLVWIDWRLAMLAFATLPLFALTVAWSERIYGRIWPRLLASQETLNSRILDYVHGMPTLRSLGLGGQGFEALGAALHQHWRTSCDTVTRLTPTVALGWTVLDFGFCILMAGGAFMVMEGDVAPGMYLLFLVVGLVFYGPIADAFDLAGYGRLLERTMMRVREVLALEQLPEPEQPQVPRSLDIRFEAVSFSYGETPALRAVDLAFEAGRIHAMVGASGSGKSTVLALLCRFWDPQQGRITVGGVDLRDMAPELRASLFAPVFQDSYLFDETVAGNIRLGRPEATQQEIEDAAWAARCHDFIMALPEGYGTRVGEGGSRLSGGERQRIAIARAILKDAPILLLDEATASVDPDNEHDIRMALARLCIGRTVILIAHRPATIRNVDQVVTFSGGSVVSAVRHFQAAVQASGEGAASFARAPDA